MNENMLNPRSVLDLDDERFRILVSDDLKGRCPANDPGHRDTASRCACAKAVREALRSPLVAGRRLQELEDLRSELEWQRLARAARHEGAIAGLNSEIERQNLRRIDPEAEDDQELVDEDVDLHLRRLRIAVLETEQDYQAKLGGLFSFTSGVDRELRATRRQVQNHDEHSDSIADLKSRISDLEEAIRRHHDDASTNGIHPEPADQQLWATLPDHPNMKIEQQLPS